MQFHIFGLQEGIGLPCPILVPGKTACAIGVVGRVDGPQTRRRRNGRDVAMRDVFIANGSGKGVAVTLWDARCAKPGKQLGEAPAKSLPSSCNVHGAVGWCLAGRGGSTT